MRDPERPEEAERRTVRRQLGHSEDVKLNKMDEQTIRTNGRNRDSITGREVKRAMTPQGKERGPKS